MVEIYESRGMTKADAQALIDLLARYKNIFIDTMMVEGESFLIQSNLCFSLTPAELGMMSPDPDDSPAKAGAITFASFFVCGLVPLIAYIITEAAGVKVSSPLLLLLRCTYSP